jgi:transcriptional regulator with PAS, ATPase and Fis domain
MDYFNSIIGQSPAFDSLIRSARLVASTDVTVFLKGETGTGKEILADAIQKQSPRADKTFIKLNCAALPESLIESELFGHKKGSFTGATCNTQGLLPAADGGTLFLDEINSLPIAIQAKLLRFLESGEYLAVGDISPCKVDVRIVAATNTDISKQIHAGEFRRDLYYRLNVVPLELPPLAQRTEDIEPLIKHFLALFSESYAIAAPRFSKTALRVLKSYSWPGNIRELRNLCERLSILLSGKTIEPENLPSEFVRLSNVSSPKITDFTLPETGVQMDALEADLIYQALSRTQGNRSKSAKLLGLSRDALIYRMQKHGVASH